MSTDKKIFVHNRIGLLGTLSCMRTNAPQCENNVGLPVPPPRLPSPIDTDTDEDNGYKSLENTGRNGSREGCLIPTTSGRLSSSDVFMPPPSTPSVVKKRSDRGLNKLKSTISTPMSKNKTKQWVTSTPNVDAQYQRKNCKKTSNVSLNWDSEDEGRFSQQSTNTDNGTSCCDNQLCECQPQLKFSFAINCEDADSVVHSTFSGDDADRESIGSKDDLSFDDDEKVLSGDRLSQMTRTYHDIEAVTHLLEEKERDLELAARIGQTLLQKNREIVQKNEVLEEQLAGALEEVSQLRHEISLKEDLLHTYADDDTDSSGAPSPVKELRNFGRTGMYNHIEGLQVKIRKLEAESNHLKNEHAKFQTENEALESEEQQLVSDTVKELDSLRDELRESRENNRQLTEELSQRNEEALRQQEEMTRLLTQIVDMQRKQKQLALENEELQQHLTAANNTQYELTREVQELGERYQEVTHMLDETREEARLLRDYPEQYGTSVPFSDSLAAELECSGGMSTELQFQDSQSLSFYNPSPGSINWSSPPSSVIDEEHGVETAGPDFHSLGKALRGVRSEPRPRGNRNDVSLSQRVLNTARFVNNVKNFSMNSKFQYATPKKQDRPIPTPLPIPGSNRSPRFIHASPDSTPSSGRCMSSTPHDKHRASSRSSFHNYTRSIHGFVTPLKNASPLALSTSNCSNRPTSLRLQLANRKLAQQSCVAANETGLNSFTHNSVQPPNSISRLNRSMSAMPSSTEEIFNKRAERSWHGESLETLAEEHSKRGFTTPSLGRPGIPGTEDLERAIRKLALRRESARYMEMDKRSAMNDESFNALCASGTITPDSSMPSGGRTPPPSCPGSPKHSRNYRYGTRSTPKLRIIKPLEGSVTLNQWKYLAERDRLLSALQLQAEMPSGIMTRERVVEVLSRSKDNSLTNTSEADSKVNLLSSPIVDQSVLADTSRLVESTMVTNSRPIPNASSSPTLKRRVSVSELEESITATSTTKAPQLSPICPGKGFASTSTRYTFINSRVMNPSDDSKTVPSCSTMTQTSSYCNTRTSMSTSSSDQSKQPNDKRAYLSHIHPFLTGQSKNQDKAKHAEVAKRFFSENTRTCSMQLGLAHLFKEHSVRGLPNPQESVSDASVFTEPDKVSMQDSELDSPPLIGSGESSAFTLKTSKPQSAQSSGHIVWNRNLQRTFLLPSLPTKNIFFNINRRSDPKKPETPPNSPLTTTPSSSSFLLNDIITEVTQAQEVTSPEPKQEGIFSSNLLSKLALIGFNGIQAFRSQTSAVDRTQVATSSTSTCSTVCSTHISSTRASMSKCATAPGCLQTKVASWSIPRPSSEEKTDCDVSDQSDKGLQMDMAQLHGSSGTLNIPDGYLDEASDEERAHASSTHLTKLKEDYVTDVAKSSQNGTKSKVRLGKKTKTATPKSTRSKSRSDKK